MFYDDLMMEEDYDERNDDSYYDGISDNPLLCAISRDDIDNYNDNIARLYEDSQGDN